MFQIIFNAISAAELSGLPKLMQLDLLSDFQLLPNDLDALDGDDRFGRLEREGRKLYRFRAKDYRIYFERCPEGVTVHRILHKNTLGDFLYRSKLPMVADEDEHLGQTRKFWQLIDEGARSGRAG
ncbi:MAG: hypothetical protein JO295_01235 [Verrucomicrobia bacterium]|nr:hypothetical protein [Verrucomicrobiota bacterium]